MKEFLKYQVCLVGAAKDCEQVKAILDYDKVHLLEEYASDINCMVEDIADYVVICGDIDESILKN